MSKLLLFSVMMLLLSACQPPSEAERLGWQTPYWYWHLQRQPLSKPLSLPVQEVQLSQISDTWGAARSAGRRHEGVDIFAKRGTPVLSTTRGVVREVGTNNLGGKVIWVTGPAFSSHYYAHLDDYAANIQAGDWVEAGTLLGYVGNTGNARGTPPHLHYGIYLKGQGAVNPYPYFKEEAR